MTLVPQLMLPPPVVALVLGILVSMLMPSASAQSLTSSATVEGVHFEISRFAVTGNTLLPQSSIDAALAPFVGTDRRFADVLLALEALEDAYRGAGHDVVQVVVPPQEMSDGVVQFRVIEAKLGKLTIEGNQHFSTENVRRSLPALGEGAPPNSTDLAVQLRMANENPAKQTTALLRGGAADNEVDAVIRVRDERPWKVVATVDNSGNDATGNYRVGLGFQHANVTERDDVLNVQAITSPGQTDDVRIFGAGYHLPLYDLNSAIDLVAGYSSVNSGTVQGLFDVSGKGTIYSARWTYYLPSFTEYEHKASLGYNWGEYQSRVLTNGISLVSDYRLSPVSLTYSGLWRAPRAEFGFHVTQARNIPGGTDGGQATFDALRVGAPDDYMLTRAGFNYALALPAEMRLRLAMSGQYSNDPLLPAEQFGLGGLGSVRGYQSRTFTGDRGYDGQAEVHSPDLGRAFGLANVSVRALVFYDWGEVSRLLPQAGELASRRASSTGVALLGGDSRHWNLRADYAHVHGSVRIGDVLQRFNFSFAWSF